MSRTVAARMWGRCACVILCLAALGGCAGLSGNIKGSFACAAPDGICAPSAVIDDRALAMITADPSADPMPAGPYQEQNGKLPPARTAKAPPAGAPVTSDGTRSRERVMRIVFPAFIDERGRLHEASAIHAVVAQGEWQSGAEAVEPAPARNALAAAPQMPSLAETVDRAEGRQAVDPTLPTPAAVEAARARKADPVATIKSDVARRLAATRRDARASTEANPGSHAAGTPAPAQDGAGTPAPDAKPPLAPPPAAIMRAAAFPGAIAEDQ
ncbi:TraV family lipoprotein [Sphingobium sp. EM0848]|uniref:TraV family lipoprotein n=1 Tax=Sphingobium sp. EM0848 TaxID=2743473 RepID=UPI00159C6567|nr:TraV family lipoprotein [Sphingobium sp. EM0848]